ncbi:hypothetical protein DNTS_024136 [Danionella cerebrum]|uniref:Uncharacterized protein n=1 Tax=Danionella cerebrum TaxID=2873325 RepID=A0A553RDV4_9TELE|nr:hypothetical protein DNTS_024136 [Danionella translucida]
MSWFIQDGVAEQFAIAEAKLRAWTSVDEEEMEEESLEEDPAVLEQPITSTLSSDAELSNQSCPLPSQTETDMAEIQLSQSERGKSGGDSEEGVILEAELHKAERRPLWSKADSCYHSTSYSESGLSPEEDEEEEDGREVEEGEDNVFQEVIRWYRHCRSVSDTSGAVSLDEEDEEEEEQEDTCKQ